MQNFKTFDGAYREASIWLRWKTFPDVVCARANYYLFIYSY